MVFKEDTSDKMCLIMWKNASFSGQNGQCSRWQHSKRSCGQQNSSANVAEAPETAGEAESANWGTHFYQEQGRRIYCFFFNYCDDSH